MKGIAARRRAKDTVKVKEIPKGSSQRKRGYLWIVESRLGGTRRRKFFRHNEADERDAHIEELEESLENLAKEDRPVLNDAELLEHASRAARALAPHGKTIADAAAFYLHHLAAEAARDSTTVSEMVKRCLDEREREGVSERHYGDLKNRLARFSKEFGETPIASIDRNVISSWVLALEVAPQTKVNFRRVLSNLFGFAVKAGVIPSNPVRDAASVKVRRKKAVILSPGEVAKLLTACPDKALPSVVLMVFCGIRNGEVYRLDWSEIDWEDSTIEISAEKAKREEHARHATIPANALEWLRPLAKVRGPIADYKSFYLFAKALEAVRKDAGWEPGTWPGNALRKTFISCHFETVGSIDETAKQAGTSVGVIHKSYRKLIKKRVADELWEIRPSDQKGDNVYPISS